MVITVPETQVTYTPCSLRDSGDPSTCLGPSYGPPSPLSPRVSDVLGGRVQNIQPLRRVLETKTDTGPQRSQTGGTSVPGPRGSHGLDLRTTPHRSSPFVIVPGETVHDPPHTAHIGVKVRSLVSNSSSTSQDGNRPLFVLSPTTSVSVLVLFPSTGGVGAESLGNGVGGEEHGPGPVSATSRRSFPSAPFHPCRASTGTTVCQGRTFRTSPPHPRLPPPPDERGGSVRGGNRREREQERQVVTETVRVVKNFFYQQNFIYGTVTDSIQRLKVKVLFDFVFG